MTTGLSVRLQGNAISTPRVLKPAVARRGHDGLTGQDKQSDYTVIIFDNGAGR